MDSTSSSSSTSAPAHYEYDVFLSFRGQDTRHSFTDHLYKALYQAGIRAFRDDDEIREGQELNPEIQRSITQSRASIVVFSENFANSRWCLDELCVILEQKSKCNHFVLAVFYKVDPSDVRNQRGSYNIQVKEGVVGTKWTEANVRRWKAALTEVANLKGMVVSGYETTFIPNIVKKFSLELGLKLHNAPTGVTGIETRAERVNTWLNNEKTDSPVLAICGMGGGGKTTLAKHIYYSNKHNFDRCSLLEDIDKHPDGLLGVQKKLLNDISANANMIIYDKYDGAIKLKNAIQMNKVLIVVDDIDDKDTLSTLFGPAFPTQSKIIITTRLLYINNWFGSISSGCHVHKIELLNTSESLELLYFHAFGSKFPMKGFEELALQLAQYCGGNPLVLKVLGSSLSEGTRIETWRSTINSLNSLKGDLDHKIQCVLQKSFESLPCESHRELFLHIACLFIDESAYDVKRILEDDYHAESGMVILTNRCLLTRTRSGFNLAMHKLLQDMARNIVRNKSKDPAKHSRVWLHDECYSLLRKGDGSKTIEGLALDMKMAKQGMRSEAFKTSSLVKMKNLKYLHLYAVKLTGSYKNFPDLRWLRWHGCNLKTLPPGLLMSSLVAIEMSHGDLEKFEPPMGLNSLKILDLARSYKLVSIRYLHRLSKLCSLDIHDCISLTYVCKTIGDLKYLSFFNFACCPKLFTAIYSRGGSPKQPFLSFPQSLSQLSLANNPFETLPSYIDLKMLRTLFLRSCPNLKILPCLPSTLKVLEVDWCTSLETITFQSARFTLQTFDYEGCFKLCEIEGLFKLVSIANVDEAAMEHMHWIKAFQDNTVDLVGDMITNGRTFNTQMLDEYGIRSVYLQGIKNQSMATHQYKSSSDFLSFRVPLHPTMCRIKGLNVTVLYRSLGEDRNSVPTPLFVRISNRTKGVTWVYNPLVYCQPRVDEDALWLSYWPIGNTLDVDDEVDVDILVEEGTISTSGLGASLVHVDAGEVEKEEKCERIQDEEVIGGDLSGFQVTKGGYYLCRKNYFKSMIPSFLFGDNIEITDLERWRIPGGLDTFREEYSFYRNPYREKLMTEVGVSFNSERETEKMEKAVSSLVGVESVSTHKEIGRLIVVGCFDPQEVIMCIRGFQKMAQFLNSLFLDR